MKGAYPHLPGAVFQQSSDFVHTGRTVYRGDELYRFSSMRAQQAVAKGADPKRPIAGTEDRFDWHIRRRHARQRESSKALPISATQPLARTGPQAPVQRLSQSE